MKNILKKLIADWREEANSEKYGRSDGRSHTIYAFRKCADELEAMLNATHALSQFIEGNGLGLPHGTIAWIVSDEKLYVREWHPMVPTPEGRAQGNWWPLEHDGPRFSENEVTHYSIIEVPKDVCKQTM